MCSGGVSRLAVRYHGRDFCKMSTSEKSLIPRYLCREYYHGRGGGNNLENITHVETAAGTVATAWPRYCSSEQESYGAAVNVNRLVRPPLVDRTHTRAPRGAVQTRFHYPFVTMQMWHIRSFLNPHKLQCYMYRSV